MKSDKPTINLERKPRQGRPAPGATIKEIASQSGVSVATVSRVLNGSPKVAESTRESVMKQARASSYVTNRSARALAGGRTGLIGLSVPFFDAEYFMQIVAGAAAGLKEHDAEFVVSPTEHEHDAEVSLLERVLHGSTDGAILVLPSESVQELEELKRWGCPFVVVDPSHPTGDSIPTVTAAHWSGGRMMTDHLISLGHRRIGAIKGTEGWIATTERLGGYHAALAAAGIPADAGLVADGDFQIQGGYGAAMQLLSRAIRPTAIFAFNDNMAVGALKAARDMGIGVPRELSIAGVDDAAAATITVPNLTTVQQPLREMGRLGVDILYRLIGGQQIGAMRVELSTRLVVRESTVPPPQ